MKYIMPNVKLTKSGAEKIVIYILVFLMALHVTPSLYINSSFLAQFVGDDFVGWVFAISSLLALFFFTNIKVFLNEVGNYKVFITALTIDLITFGLMSLNLFITDPKWGYVFVISFIINQISRLIALFNLDIFLEHISSDKDTGGIRGIYLTSLNTAFVLGPLIAGYLITDEFDAAKVYVWAMIILIPMILISIRHLKDFRDSTYKKNNLIKTVKSVIKNRSLSRLYYAAFILNLFYSLMVIYVPIYMVDIGFKLGEVGTITGIALIAFIIFQLPAGYIADKFIGEKELLSIGFIISGLATIAITFFSQNVLWLWIIILFITRTGAALVEIMTETYFFKKTNDQDIDKLSLYRSISSLSYIFGPVIASLLLLFIDVRYVFLVVGIIILTASWTSWQIKDTK